MSTFEATYLRILDDLRKEFAVDALAKPRHRDAFEFGRSSGVLEGIEKSRERFLALLEEKKNDNRIHPTPPTYSV